MEEKKFGVMTVHVHSQEIYHQWCKFFVLQLTGHGKYVRVSLISYRLILHSIFSTDITSIDSEHRVENISFRSEISWHFFAVPKLTNKGVFLGPCVLD